MTSENATTGTMIETPDAMPAVPNGRTAGARLAAARSREVRVRHLLRGLELHHEDERLIGWLCSGMLDEPTFDRLTGWLERVRITGTERRGPVSS